MTYLNMVFNKVIQTVKWLTLVGVRGNEIRIVYSNGLFEWVFGLGLGMDFAWNKNWKLWAEQSAEEEWQSESTVCKNY